MDVWLAFVMASVVVTLLPGPSMLLVIAKALAEGPARSLATVMGVVVADACLMLLALAGVGAVIYSSAVAFTTLKWLGAAYLVYLGVRQWRAAARHTGANDADGPAAPAAPSGGGFLVGFVTTMLNPKIIGFFIAFFPQFVVDGVPLALQLAILGSTFLAIVLVIMTLYAMLAGQVRLWIRKPSVRALMDRVAGATLIGAGVVTATLRRA